MAEVLVVDDEECIRDYFCLTIESMGHKVLSATNGQDAYDILNSHDVDLLITDILMLELNGRKLIENILEEERFANLPILIASGYVGDEDVTDLLEMGVKGFLQKPVEIEILKEAIAKNVKN